MRLAQVRLENFRCHKDTASIAIGNLTAIIGKNDSGKSSILEALDIFFDESKKPEQDDATRDGDSKNCRIVCQFDQLPATLILDAERPTTLQAEYLLNNEGRL